MGADIHLIAQVRHKRLNRQTTTTTMINGIKFSVTRKRGAWETIELTDYALNARNYIYFSIMADVRNSFELVGRPWPTNIETIIDHHTTVNRIIHRAYNPDAPYGIPPIALPRGLPSDITVTSCNNYIDNYGCYHWLGEHSCSWITIEEFLNYPHWNDRLVTTGYMNYANFKRLLDGKPVESYCSWVGGKSLKIAQTLVDLTLVNNPNTVALAEDLSQYDYIQVRWLDTTLKESCADKIRQAKSLRRRWPASDYDMRLVFGFDS